MSVAEVLDKVTDFEEVTEPNEFFILKFFIIESLVDFIFQNEYESDKESNVPDESGAQSNSSGTHSQVHEEGSEQSQPPSENGGKPESEKASCITIMTYVN